MVAYRTAIKLLNSNETAHNNNNNNNRKVKKKESLNKGPRA